MAGVDHQPFVVRLIDQNFQQLLPNPLVPPADEAAVRVAPAPVVRRQIAPRGARSQNPKDCINEQAIVFGDTTPDAFAPRSVRLQKLPCFIGYIVATVDGNCTFQEPSFVGIHDALISFIS